MAMQNLENIDCFVKLEILSDEQIAVLCRPKPRAMMPADVPQSIAENVPEPAAFIEVIDFKGNMILMSKWNSLEIYWFKLNLIIFFLLFSECAKQINKEHSYSKQ